jgi:predicted ATPase
LKLSKLSRKARQRALEEGIQTADDQAKHGSLTRVRQEDDEEQAVVPLGLYIHGEVGCGKTLLMDLFYDNAPTTMKKRMQSVFVFFPLSVHMSTTLTCFFFLALASSCSSCTQV